MKKHLLLCFAIGLCLFLPCGAAFAQENTLRSAYTQQLLDSLDLTQWQALAPQSDINALLVRFSQGDFTMDVQSFTQLCSRLLAGQATYTLPLLLRMAAFAVLTGLLTRLEGAFAREETAKLCRKVVFLAACVPLMVDFMGMVRMGAACVSGIEKAADLILPTMLVLTTATGANSTTAFLQPLLLSSGNLLYILVKDIVLPLVGLAAILTAVNTLTEERRFSSLLKTLQTICHWALGCSFAAYLGLLSIGGIAAGTVDTVAVRTAKYTVDNLVPVMGGLFKDAVETLVGCSAVVKNAVGMAGLVTILHLLAEPVLSMGLIAVMYRLCGAVLQPLGDPDIPLAMEGLASLATTLALALLTVGAVFFVFLSVLMSCGVHL